MARNQIMSALVTLTPAIREDAPKASPFTSLPGCVTAFQDWRQDVIL
jgi:hypothetical protein